MLFPTLFQTWQAGGRAGIGSVSVGYHLLQAPLPTQGLVLHPCSVSPLDGDSHSSTVDVALHKLILSQRLSAYITGNPAGL